MRKILSLILVFIMLLSIMPVAYAASEINCSECGTAHTQCASCEKFLFCDTCLICNECGYIPTTRDASQGTQVFFDAEDPDGDGNKDNMESWTVTVPAVMFPAGTGHVIASGSWASNRKLVVSADKSVALINDISKGDERILDVYFDGIELIGNNKESVFITKEISVAAMSGDALFGTWEGIFEYQVEMVNNEANVFKDVLYHTTREIDDDGNISHVKLSSDGNLYAYSSRYPFPGEDKGNYSIEGNEVLIEGIEFTISNDGYTLTAVIDGTTFTYNYIPITFTIDGILYHAEEGISWEEWLGRDYNTGNFAEAKYGSISNDNGETFVLAPETGYPVYRGNTIIANAAYYTGSAQFVT